MPLHNYVLYMYSDTDRGLCNGPKLPRLRSDALKLCSLCQPGFLHPSRGVTCRDQTRLLIAFLTHKNDARGRMELDEDCHKYQCFSWILSCSFFPAGNPFPVLSCDLGSMAGVLCSCPLRFTALCSLDHYSPKNWVSHNITKIKVTLVANNCGCEGEVGFLLAW